MIRFLMMFLLIAFASVSEAKTFPDITDAANYALTKAYYTCSHRTECGGFIVQTKNGYVVTEPVQGVEFGNPAMGDLYAALEGKGFKIVGDWHTHICSPHNFLFSTFFSAADVDSNDGLKMKAGYMLSLCDNMIRVYRPGLDDRDDEEIDFKPHPDGTVHDPIYLTIGHIVGYVPVEKSHARTSRVHPARR